MVKKIASMHLSEILEEAKNSWFLCKLEKHVSPTYVNYIKKTGTEVVSTLQSR